LNGPQNVITAIKFYHLYHLSCRRMTDYLLDNANLFANTQNPCNLVYSHHLCRDLFITG